MWLLKRARVQVLFCNIISVSLSLGQWRRRKRSFRDAIARYTSYLYTRGEKVKKNKKIYSKLPPRADCRSTPSPHRPRRSKHEKVRYTSTRVLHKLHIIIIILLVRSHDVTFPKYHGKTIPEVLCYISNTSYHASPEPPTPCPTPCSFAPLQPFGVVYRPADCNADAADVTVVRRRPSPTCNFPTWGARTNF